MKSKYKWYRLTITHGGMSLGTVPLRYRSREICSLALEDNPENKRYVPEEISKILEEGI